MSLQTLIIISLVFAGFMLASAPDRGALLTFFGFRRKAGPQEARITRSAPRRHAPTNH